MKTSSSFFKTLTLSLILLVTSANAWGDVGFEQSDCGIKYYNGGSSDVEWNFSGQTAQTKDLGDISQLFLKQWFAKMYQNEDNTIYGQTYHKMYYKIHRTAVSAGTSGFTEQSANWWSWGNWSNSWRYPKGGHNDLNINLLNGLGSGKYSMTFYFQHNGKSTYKSQTNTLKWTYNIVPNIKDFKVSVSNSKSGTGASNDPYIIAYGKNMELTVSGEKASTDANSSLYASFGDENNYSATLTKTYSSIPTTKQSVTVYAKYYNSNDKLSGTKETKTIYYRSENVYTVTFNANGHGTAPAAQTISEGGKASQPTAPTTTGYEFGGWYKEAGCTNAFDFNTAITANITLYAKWTENTYSVTISAGTGGTVSPSGSQTIGQVTQTTITATPKSGYRFVDWTTTGGVVKVTETNSKEQGSITITAAAAGTVTANFEAIPETKYAVTISSAGNGTVSPSGEQQIGASGMDVTATANTGYQFDGWKVTGGASVKDENNATTTVTATVDGTVTAHFSEIKYTIPVSSNNNNYGTVNTESVSVGISTYATISATPEVGYKFKQWQVEGGAVVASTTDATTTITATGTGSVTATFEETKYTISVVSSNGEFGTVSTASISVGQHTASANIIATEKTGCEFVGWIATDGIIIASPSNKTTTIKATKEGTLTAIFKEKQATTVYLRANGLWKADGAKLAVYAWNASEENTWIDVEYDDCTGDILMADIPAKYNTGIKFVRLNPNPTENNTRLNQGYNFDNAWNETSNLNIPTNNKKLYDLTNDYIYLKPNSNWTKANARFAARFFKSSGSGEAWKDMTDADGDGYYSCNKPSEYDMVIFCRMNPATIENKWENRWDQSKDQKIPNNNLFVVDDGQWGGNGNDNSGATGNWDNNHWDNSQWTTYTAPTYTVTINATTNGTIEVAYGGKTYTSGQKINNVPIHTELNITFTPADGYILTTPLVTYADVVADNIYSICGPAVISAEFVPQGTTKTIYLRPNDDWLKDDAIFIAHAWKDGSSDLHDYLMTTKDDDYTGSYSCTIDSKYDHVLFARINPEYKTNQELSEKWMWNKTKNLQITDDILDANGYRFAIGGKDGDLYDGKWEENTPIWGLSADFNLWHAEDAIFRGYPGKVDILLHSETHQFVLYNIKTEEYCHNNGTYTRGNSGQWWSMNINTQDNCKLVADVDRAIYQFQMQYVTQTGTFKKQISITYPNTGVYYLAYQEGDNTKSFRKSHAIDKITEGEKLDTISFFVNVDNTPYLYLLDHAGNVLAKHSITGTGGADPNNAMLPGKRNSDATLYVGAGCGVENKGVYNFILHQEGNEAQIDAAATHLYTGSYYIRTDASEGGWNDFRQKSNMMTYSSYAESHSNFNHYFCKWVESSAGTQSNIKFTIANDYSFSLSDTLNSDKFIEKVGIKEGCLPEDANVRFGWDSRTNEVSRAYIKGAGSTSDRFLVLTGKDENLKDANGQVIPEGTGERKGLLANEEILVDQQNWIYIVDVTANKNTEIQLTAKYNNLVQYFKGDEGKYHRLLNSSASKDYKIRIIYDFKTNHLVYAWLADGNTITDKEVLGCDMMVIRRNQEPADQLNFNPQSSPLEEVGIGYAVMTFTKDHILDNDLSERERSLYWVSFPFDVKISDVFGFGEYAEHWILQYYDGAERAEKGLFSDSGTYWKYIFDTNTELEAGKGYVLVLDLNKVEFPHGATEVSLYFPSTGPLNTITGELPTEATIPEHWCKIDREWTENEGKPNEVTYHHKYTDSHWNLIGVPGFADINDFDVTAYHFLQGDASFYYAFDLVNSTYTVASAATNFQAMYAYMVQFAGTINWMSKTISNTPEEEPEPKLAARRYSDEQPEKVVLRLELAQGEEVADRTFVQMQQEGATANFDLSLDLTKIVNIGVSNIYTLTDSLKIQTAGNVLPFEETTVAVGVDIATAGEYTFRMPDGTEGMVVELIDHETNTTTNLLLDDYTVTLPAGSNETRFALSLKPEKTATSIESTTTPSDSNIRKFIIDGKLYLQKDGMLYDAQGRCVK